MRFTTAVYASFHRMVALPLKRSWVDSIFQFSMGLDRRFGSNTACWQFNRVARKRTNWVVGVTAGRSAAEEAADLDTYQGQRPDPTQWRT
jgi:hypothetical protein